MPRLIALWPAELSDESLSGSERIIAVLRSAIRRERQRGRSGHWSYNLERHAALLKALQAEKANHEKLRERKKCSDSA